VTAPGGIARPTGFLLLVLGLGLRLDSSWQGAAWLLILAGGAVAAAGLWTLGRAGLDAEPFVPRRAGE